MINPGVGKRIDDIDFGACHTGQMVSHMLTLRNITTDPHFVHLKTDRPSEVILTLTLATSRSSLMFTHLSPNA